MTVARADRFGPATPLQIVVDQLFDELPARAVLRDDAALRTYESDGLTLYRTTPGAVVLVESTRQAQAVISACARHGVPFVARGSGTGLSGGALPLADGVLLVLSKMREITELSPDDQRAIVEPGVRNLQLTRAAEPAGFYFAPDPSSQQICSLGGNVAENSGGAHCLKYGFTTNHVLSVELITAGGDLVTLGSRAPDTPGYDLVGAVVGSEGTLGVVTSATVRLTRLPQAVRTLLVGFPGVEEAGAATSEIIGAGIVPAAIEMMDALAIQAAEAATHCNYPAGAGAVLVIEMDGPTFDVDIDVRTSDEICRRNGAFEIRIAESAAERAMIWKGRKSAFAAVGRISPNYLVQDGVIPRTALPAVLKEIDRLAIGSGLRVANVFHAGDGNLHPLVLFDDSVPGEGRRAEELAGHILRLCIERGGSITGEHGVGTEKSAFMAEMFSPDDLATMQLVRCAFDPAGLANPTKIFPTPRLCGEPPGRRSGRGDQRQLSAVGEVF